MKYIATCKIGLESLVAAELRRLDIKVDAVLDARVQFSGGYDAMARACLWLRTAERVLMEVGSFEARSFDALYEGVKRIAWNEYLTPQSNIHVKGKSAKSGLFSVSDCQSITKKAIVENLKHAYRTGVIAENGEEVIVEVGLLRDVATLALDCCGAGLSRRGYRTYNVAAPIAETLGAAIVLLSGYGPGSLTQLIDPMCGAGTMPIEAAMIARNIAPGMNRAFAAEAWRFIPAAVFASARGEAKDVQLPIAPDIIGSDIDGHCIDLCKLHAKKAGVTVNWQVKPLKALLASDVRQNAIIVCNPPYGERMMERKQAEQLYREMRQVLEPLPYSRLSVITSHPDFERIYGSRAGKRRKLSNGGMPCTLYLYFRRG